MKKEALKSTNLWLLNQSCDPAQTLIFKTNIMDISKYMFDFERSGLDLPVCLLKKSSILFILVLGGILKYLIFWRFLGLFS